MTKFAQEHEVENMNKYYDIFSLFMYHNHLLTTNDTSFLYSVLNATRTL